MKFLVEKVSKNFEHYSQGRMPKIFRENEATFQNSVYGVWK